MQGDILIFGDERINEINVMTRTSVGGWQYVCDQHGDRVDLRPDVRRDRVTAERVYSGFRRGHSIFEAWWRRPL